MTTAREDILNRIRTAHSDAQQPVPVPRAYRTSAPADVDLLTERLVDYRAVVFRARPGDAGRQIAAAIAGRQRLVVPDGFPRQMLAGIDADLLPDDPQLTATDLDAVDGVVTTCAVAIAETGTIVLDGGSGQGRRILTLVPDYHLVVVIAGQVVGNVVEAISRLEPTRPLTWISGPSATSDIELTRVEGVHGPRTLHVVIVDSD